MSHPITRRGFVQSLGLTAGMLACAANVNTGESSALAYATLRARPGKPTENVKKGLQPLRLGAERDGFLYVPASYSPEKATPMMVLLHGAGSSSSEWSASSLLTLFDDPPIVVMAPDSRSSLWDVSLGGFGQDVRFIDDALDLTFHMCNIDRAHLALAGFSDGASYTLSLGITNGDLFTALMAFSPGYMKPAARRGAPRIFIAHGRQDQTLPIASTSRAIVPSLRKDGYQVTYEELDGGHTLKLVELQRAVRWFTQA